MPLKMKPAPIVLVLLLKNGSKGLTPLALFPSQVVMEELLLIRILLLSSPHGEQIALLYANEADMLNVALFGKTAKQWREQNAAEPGNIRDHATLEQLVVLTNLESNNALLIRQGISQTETLRLLNESAIHQMKSLLGNRTMERLPR